MNLIQLTEEEIALLNSKEGLYALLKGERVNIKKALEEVKYEFQLKQLQEELIKLQNWFYGPPGTTQNWKVVTNAQLNNLDI